MLDEKDLQAIQKLVEQSEARMMSYIQSAVMPKFDETEARIMEAITPKFGETEARMAAYMEAYFDPKFNGLADGQKLLKETLAPKSRVEELEEEVAFLKPIVMSMLTDIDKLKKAQ